MQAAPDPLVDILASEFAEAYLEIKRRPFSFDGYQFFRRIYDTGARGMVLKTARQVAKSTTIAAKMIMWACSIEAFNCLYVAPTENHISMFSKQKLTPLLASPFIRKHFFSRNKVDQAFYKQFTTMSDITLRSCFLDPESVRGISCDMIGIDELQNIHMENIPVIEECYTKSDYQYGVYSGTPKTNQHATEYYWDLSTKNEWLLKCTGCNYWNFLDESCIMPHGLSCTKCHKLLPRKDPEAGEWVSFDMTRKNRMEGYRISQLMVPWIPWDLEEAIAMRGENADERATIMYKYRKYPRGKFYNEVMGLSYDDATCPITLTELLDACDPKLRMREDRSGHTVMSRMTLYAGIDWSTSLESSSYTILTIGGFIPSGRFVVVYAKRYEGAESDLKPMLAHIVQKLRDFGVKVVGVDWGSGADKNAILRDMVRQDQISIVEFNHSGTQKADVAWNQKAKMFIVNRTRIMTEIFNKIKNKDIVFPCWDDMQDFLMDLLNVFSDFNEALKVSFFNRLANKPDDYMHGLCFLHLVATIGQQS